jgi:purine-binding chemotaxis protein CheW
MLRVGSRAKAAPEADRVQLVAATVGKRLFGFDIHEVREIIPYRAPARTPRSPSFVEGIVEHKGRLFPVLSLRRRLGLPEPGPGGRAVLLLAWEGVSLGVSVDAATQVVGVRADELMPAPPQVFGIRAEYIRGVAKLGVRPVLWLATSRLLTSAEPITMVE